MSKPATPPTTEAVDPYLWLEDVTAPKSLDCARAQNAVTVKQLESDPGFAPLQAGILEVLDSDARIPTVDKMGAYYYNFWKDKQHERGIWRRTTLDEYRKPDRPGKPCSMSTRSTPSNTPTGSGTVPIASSPPIRNNHGGIA